MGSSEEAPWKELTDKGEEQEQEQEQEHDQQRPDSSPQRPRRFLIQPVENSTRSSHKRHLPSDDNNIRDHQDQAFDVSQNETLPESNQPRRFLPQPIETTTTSHRGLRRFKPELIETDHRTVTGSLKPQQRQEMQTPPAKHATLQSNHSIVARLNLHIHRESSFGSSESKFSYANLIRRQETRRHSFRIPELPSIPSSNSSGSRSPSRSPSSSSSPPKSSHALPTTEQSFGGSFDGEFSDYMLSLAVRSEQEQLKDQTLAAFPNEQIYEPVDHFAIEEDRDDEDWASTQPRDLKSRRESSADLSWELEYMRQHKEEAEQRLRAMGISRKPDLTSPVLKAASKALGPSPPMLGADIVLPRCASPEGTFCENKAEIGSRSASLCVDCCGLWCATNLHGNDQGVGLWMGTCSKTGAGREPHNFAGIVTPMIRDEDMELDPDHRTSITNYTTQSHTPVQGEVMGLLSPLCVPSPKLSKVPEEFHDEFVTQIYNYLSLGYPCIARDYDYELSKISGFSVEKLQQDDFHTDARGYVVAPDSDTGVACTRWEALRLYIREWARQQPNMVDDESCLESWGLPERKGSWAI
ncbi:hypothetical protein N7495_001859 [Penicillium taxi]|uniref:uncharacterized protein n=1 Tax=Penicillium taxi TaxID=168475 RepID=UPI002545A516|nr:uncharacterized protein N7495_001859 [Penicillium taxi]KAJ5909177.1 hypothetical protein N7495_001859 [Penicillium taxi]